MPALGTCTLGLTRPYGMILGNTIQLCIFMELIGFCGSSIISAFIYRYAAATDQLGWFQKRMIWIFIVCLHVFISIPSVIVFAYGSVNLITSKANLEKANKFVITVGFEPLFIYFSLFRIILILKLFMKILIKIVV
jgi:hypothetical protein